MIGIEILVKTFAEIDIKHQEKLSSFLKTYDKLTLLINTKASSEKGLIRSSAKGDGMINPNDELWIRGLATEFRKLTSGDTSEPLSYQHIRGLLYQIAILDSDTRNESLLDTFRVLKVYQKNFWNKTLLKLSYDDKVLNADNLVDIAHNGYIFHTGQDGKTRGYVASFRKEFPEMNPLVMDYLFVVGHRHFCLGSLAHCVKAFMEGELSDVSLDEYFKPDFIAEQDFLIVPITQ